MNLKQRESLINVLKYEMGLKTLYGKEGLSDDELEYIEAIDSLLDMIAKFVTDKEAQEVSDYLLDVVKRATETMCAYGVYLSPKQMLVVYDKQNKERERLKARLNQ